MSWWRRSLNWFLWRRAGTVEGQEHRPSSERVQACPCGPVQAFRLGEPCFLLPLLPDPLTSTVAASLLCVSAFFLVPTVDVFPSPICSLAVCQTPFKDRQRMMTATQPRILGCYNASRNLATVVWSAFPQQMNISAWGRRWVPQLLREGPVPTCPCASLANTLRETHRAPIIRPFQGSLI